MKFFLLFIGFIFLLFAFSVASLVWKVRKQVRRMHDALRNNMNNDNYRSTAGNGFISKPLFRSTLYDKISELIGKESVSREPEDDYSDLQGLHILVAEDNDIN